MVELSDQKYLENTKMNNTNNLAGSALHEAVQNLDVNQVKNILEKNVDVNVVDRKGRTPIHYAAAKGSGQLVEILIKKGANVNCKIQYDIKSTLDIPMLSKDQSLGKTPLHLACARLDYESVCILLKNKANVNSTDYRGLTPLLVVGEDIKINSQKSDIKNKYEKVVKKLLDFKARVTFINPEKTLLHQALKFGSLDVFNEFLKQSDPFLKDSNGDTILHVTCRAGEENFVSEVVEKFQGLVNERNNKGETPLHCAALAGSRPSLIVLINKGGDLSQKNSANLTVCDLIVANVPRPLNFLVEVLDSKLTPNEFSINDKRFQVILDFTMLIPTAEQQTQVLISLINAFPYEQKPRIVLHPLISTFIRLKWERLRILFFFLVLIHFMYVLSLSLHVCFLIKGQSMFVYKWSRYVLIFTSLVILIHILTQILLAFKYFLKEFEVWLTLICSFFSLTIGIWENFFMNEPLPPLWIRHLAAYDILLSWILLMFVLGRFPLMGYVALMFYTVLKNVIKVLIFFTCLVIGFSLSFCVQFNDMQFDDPWKAFVRTTIMLMGEYEYVDLFNNEKEMLRFKTEKGNLFVTSRIIFLLFILLGSIVLINLLTGLAVNDIHSLRAEGCLRHLIKQAEFISHIEKITTKNFNPLLMTKQIRKLFTKMQSVPRSISINPNENGNIYGKSRRVKKLPLRLVESIMLGAVRNQNKNIKNLSESIILKDGIDMFSRSRNQWVDAHITDTLNEIKLELHQLSLGLQLIIKENKNDDI